MSSQRLTIGIALAAATATISAAATNFSVDAHVVTSGTSTQSASSCFRLQATIAEAAPGYSSSPTYSLSAGFRYASRGLGGDEIFFGGFEDCTP